MDRLEWVVKRLELLREGLQEDTIDLKDALDIILEHMIDICQTLQKKVD